MSKPYLSDRQIVAFKHVMECGTVSGAAQRMLTAQPGVTRLLKQLEHDVGFALFERRRGRLVPTPEARLFYREVVRVWTGNEHLRDTARRIREREIGGLRISAMPLLGLVFIPDILADFVPTHPDARVELSTYRSEQVVEEVMTQRCDLGFAILAENDDRVDQEVFRLESLCALPEGHALEARETVAPEDLAGERLICFERHDPLRQALDHLLEREGIRPRQRLEVSLALQAIRLVHHGLGVAILDPISARAFGSGGVTLRPFAPTLGEDFALLTPRDRPASRLAQDFIALFRRHHGKLSMIDGNR
ncbi:DNA-binding transcriptional regulator, LysR family [Modicisalibacter ilicicola DSM 19980]|uniref:DNA-binding transcriptional regulator, LysR family n=1 Tax=Modicisalibacter ilicicola DSM 19980 TaxID=1121942 RepID=A0A1M5DUL9_9GAMM|nr:LysR family transcriptional regulator [Halomonas ilicicola]SHF70625.1 DNA-binding transcriptional regulator, LysR family [Halomonas ilicicola DSM 19980]